MKWLAISVGLLACLVTAHANAKGALTFDRCKVYFGDSPQIPAELKSYLRAMPHDAVEVCSHFVFPGGYSYEVRSEVMRAPSDVCLFTERFMFRDGKGGWKDEPDKKLVVATERVWTYMTIADGPCPRQDSADYVATRDTPPEIFVDVVKYWYDLVTAPERHKAFMAGMNSRYQPDFSDEFPAYLSQVTAENYWEFVGGVGVGSDPRYGVSQVYLGLTRDGALLSSTEKACSLQQSCI
ncbi:hypothetical protein [Oleomonas cavernae]|nr:hypothetical protein [Oleomonas cavernae]